ncbi:MAG TPA: antibiotic biosynthesis monooxygenase family protein [Flavitalea sp.]|nr:antibiotic biosynthesis monooxygenase family protein [Flavitalea sp.]
MKRILILIILFSNLNLETYSQTQKTNMKENFSTEIIRYKIPKSEHANFEKSYEEAGKFLQTSKFCLGYSILRGNEEPENYIITIYWTSVNDHMQGFRKSSEFGPFFKLVRPFYNNIQEMKHYNQTTVNWKRE